MKNINYFFLVSGLIILLLQSCGQTPSKEPLNSDAPAVETGEVAPTTTTATEGFFTEEVPGTELTRVFREDEDGNILEDGFLKNGVKQGPWLTYERVFIYPKSLTHYENGVVNGIYMEFTTSGQVALQAVYRNNKLNGPWSRYKGGRMEASAFYKDGELHGVYKEFMPLFGRLQKEINYKDGKQDGLYRYYDDEGKITMEYVYKNGEKISGGIVDPPRMPETEE
ncbi:MAG: hypothetical protein KTR30_34025 [Saprospiraceae bacterium]|nr:hypothetical protein [Saprospiraceae bacterium]